MSRLADMWWELHNTKPATRAIDPSLQTAVDAAKSMAKSMKMGAAIAKAAETHGVSRKDLAREMQRRSTAKKRARKATSH